MTALHALSAAELGEAFRSRRLSPVEVTDAVLAHIDRWEPTLCATWALDPAAARAAAQASEARWQRGEARGPLDGVPCTIKENIATKGVPVPVGTAAQREQVRLAGLRAVSADSRLGGKYLVIAR